MISCSPAIPHSTAQHCRDEWSWTGAAPQLQMERKREVSDLFVLRFSLKPTWCKFGTIPLEATNLLWICSTAQVHIRTWAQATKPRLFSPLFLSYLEKKENLCFKRPGGLHGNNLHILCHKRRLLESFSSFFSYLCHMPHMLDTQMEQAEMVLILAPHFYHSTRITPNLTTL